MSKSIEIQAHAGAYRVEFGEPAFALAHRTETSRHFIIDSRVAELYQEDLKGILGSKSVLLIEATEANKSLERSSEYVDHLMNCGIRRGHILVAIGGGITQDIACFLAAVLLRGLQWQYIPTTLLAQADSCIGSKSSINVGRYKNIVGTFTPPSDIYISGSLLSTLTDSEMRSGMGEMLKVHMIAGQQAFDSIAADYDRLNLDRSLLMAYVERSLLIKKRIIEEDEFDRSIRNIMNLGHSFGHAIESATEFSVPHGIAVTIGIDMANFHAAKTGRMAQIHFDRMHSTLAKNYRGFERTDIPLDAFIQAIGRDKKNSDGKLGLILPDANAIPQRVQVANDEIFRNHCAEYFADVRHH